MPPVTCTQGRRIQLFRRRSYVHIGKVVTSAKTGEASREGDTLPSVFSLLLLGWEGRQRAGAKNIYQLRLAKMTDADGSGEIEWSEFVAFQMKSRTLQQQQQQQQQQGEGHQVKRIAVLLQKYI